MGRIEDLAQSTREDAAEEMQSQFTLRRRKRIKAFIAENRLLILQLLSWSWFCYLLMW